jgi:hypothetical protein
MNKIKQQEEDLEPQPCTNCKMIIEASEMAIHTVACFRNSTKCKVCGEVIQRDRKKEHLIKWRDEKVLSVS